jgi:hypothetical protein
MFHQIEGQRPFELPRRFRQEFGLVEGGRIGLQVRPNRSNICVQHTVRSYQHPSNREHPNGDHCVLKLHDPVCREENVLMNERDQLAFCSSNSIIISLCCRTKPALKNQFIFAGSKAWRGQQVVGQNVWIINRNYKCHFTHKPPWFVRASSKRRRLLALMSLDDCYA